MSSTPRKNRLAFRPALNDVRLEERVVLNAARPSALIAGAWGYEARQERLALRQIQQSYFRQIRTTQTFLTQFASDQAAKLAGTPENWGPDGRLTPQALGNYGNAMAGGLNATTFRLASQVSLLPNSTRAVMEVQDSMIGLGSNSLGSRMAHLAGSPRAATSPWLLQRAVNRAIGQAFDANVRAVGRYFHTTPVSQLAVDPTTGQRIPLSQYLGERAVAQINNIFGAFANSVGDIAAQTIFDADGNYNPAGAPAFEQLYVQALSTAGNQIAGVLSVFPNGASLAPRIQEALFATGINSETGLPNVSLLNALINSLPTPAPEAAPVAMALQIGSPVVPPIVPQPGPLDLSQFRTTFQSQFTPAFQNLMAPVNTFFGVPQPAGLPSGFFAAGATFPNVFSPPFTATTFNSGFNNGFLTSGSGFPGFGIAPSGFNASFGSGFNGLIGSMNQPFGFTAPTLFNAGVGGIGGIQTGGTGIGGIV